MKLAVAQGMVEAALAHARSRKMSPLAIVVLDARGALKVAAAEDGTSLKRSEIAIGKAQGALALIRSKDGELLGVIGISGDTSDNDEAAAMVGIAAVDLVGDPGA